MLQVLMTSKLCAWACCQPRSIRFCTDSCLSLRVSIMSLVSSVATCCRSFSSLQSFFSDLK